MAPTIDYSIYHWARLIARDPVGPERPGGVTLLLLGSEID